VLGTGLWNYQLWGDVQRTRIYRSGQRERLDVYQRLVNYNLILNVSRAPLLQDFSYMALDRPGRQAFQTFLRGRPRRIQLERERPSLLEKLAAAAGSWLDRTFGWDKLPVPLGIFALAGIRDRLRATNLFDTGVPARGGTPSAVEQRYRTADGRWNDLDHPTMGAVETPFGRNVAPGTTNPRPSRPCRHPSPAWSAGLCSPGRSSCRPRPSTCWPPPGCSSRSTTGSATLGRPTSSIGSRLVTVTPSPETGRRAHPPRPVRRTSTSARTRTGGTARRSRDHLRKEERRKWDDDELFEVARLVNVALMAEILTTEWTPAILAHPTTEKGMRINWWVISERLRRAYGRVSPDEVISGIPAPPAHLGVPYCLTEEFVAVYRMHPLVPTPSASTRPMAEGSRSRWGSANRTIRV
jgi:hypothetical protein